MTVSVVVPPNVSGEEAESVVPVLVAMYTVSVPEVAPVVPEL